MVNYILNNMLVLKLARKSLYKQLIKSNRMYSTKLSYKHQIGQYPLMYKTLGQLYKDAATKYSDQKILISKHQNEHLLFHELIEKGDQLAAGLYAIGGQYGDRIGIWAPNILEWQIVNVACARGGFILVPLNPMYEASEMEYCINKVGIKFVICPEKSKNINHYSILNKIIPRLEEAKTDELNYANVSSLKHIIMITDKQLNGTKNFNNLLNIANQKSVENIQKNQRFINPGNPANIQFTSGTTGKPKATVLSHFNVINNSFTIAVRNEFNKKQHKICLQVPFFHAFGYTDGFIAAVHFGTTLVLPSAIYSPEENLKSIDEEKCTVIYGTPTMFIDLVSLQKQKQLDINPDMAVTGGAPCSPQLFQEIKEVLNVKIVKSMYGLTETSGVLFQSLPIEEDAEKVTNTVGHLMDHLEAKIVDSNNNVVPMGSPGELCIRGYPTMLGYWKDDKKTKDIISKDFWLRTGDQFILQEDGYGRIVGRLKDMIVRGGENIFPKEIEDLLTTHPDIIEVHVIGLSHERLGEEVCACVRTKEDSKLTIEQLIQFCSTKIAKFKIPSKLRIVEHFPKTQSGKVQKNVLKQQIKEKDA